MSAWEHAWADALSALELDVTRAESLLAAHRYGDLEAGEAAPAGAAWTAPALPGPLPECLRERAQAILQRQLRVSADLARGIATARRDLLLAQRLDTSADPAPVFLDTRF